MIRVLVAAPDASRRARLERVLRTDTRVLLVGEEASGHRLVDIAKRRKPDVIVLDGNLDDPDCTDATRRIMAEIPTPIVLVSPAKIGSEVASVMAALQAGALAVAPFPEPGVSDTAFLTTLCAMAGVKVVRRWSGGKPGLAEVATPSMRVDEPRIVAVAASTGGPAALHRLIGGLPADFPAPVVVVQHIAPGFVEGMIAWLAASATLRVKVGEDGETLQPGGVYIAPDGRHLGVSPRSTIVLSAQAPIGGFRPSATYLFRSVAHAFGAAAVCVVLTGMGEDGVTGLHDVRQAGGSILAQDEKSSVVFGMPGAVVQAGLADRLLPLDAIAGTLVALFSRR